MDFLQMKHLKRKRKSNYSVKETQTLIREIHKRREILFSRQQNMAINELKRRAWEEVADSVNALGEGELRTAAEVKRRYLDWRALMKRKQLQAELASGLKQEFEGSSPDNDASLGGGDQSLDLSGFSKDSSCDWQDLTDLGEPSTHTPGVKMEDDEASSYRLEAEVGECGEGEEDDEDCFPSILPDMDREGRVPEVFAHIDEFGMLSSTKPTSGPAVSETESQQCKKHQRLQPGRPNQCNPNTFESRQMPYQKTKKRTTGDRNEGVSFRSEQTKKERK